jgi:ankyrin repeat protein
VADLERSAELVARLLEIGARGAQAELRCARNPQRAVLLNEPRLVELLLSAGANANAAIPLDRTFQITIRGSIENWPGQPLLHWAIRFNNQKMVEVLLANGTDVNAKDGNLWTPLRLAAC